MQPDIDPPMLDEIILALRSPADGDAAAAVLELTADDLITDAAAEIVDLATILGQGDVQGGTDLTVTMTELGGHGAADVGSLWPASTTGPSATLAEASGLHIELSLYGDDPAPS